MASCGGLITTAACLNSALLRARAHVLRDPGFLNESLPQLRKDSCLRSCARSVLRPASPQEPKSR